VKIVEKSFTLLPPAPDVRQECTVDHKPTDPYNAQSLYYQTRSNMEHGHGATWSDAVGRSLRRRRSPGAGDRVAADRGLVRAGAQLGDNVSAVTDGSEPAGPRRDVAALARRGSWRGGGLARSSRRIRAHGPLSRGLACRDPTGVRQIGQVGGEIAGERSIGYSIYPLFPNPAPTVEAATSRDGGTLPRIACISLTLAHSLAKPVPVATPVRFRSEPRPSLASPSLSASI
jgi:hypothetical protein